ncbi:hypothetical protein QBC44DRAFT_153917 [Cladorrhinum sp. PSN332]|nr:hypothetical protein QBC44DRAFT_153917 [Cladorrhinum sp. PSN332]
MCACVCVCLLIHMAVLTRLHLFLTRCRESIQSTKVTFPSLPSMPNTFFSCLLFLLPIFPSPKSIPSLPNPLTPISKPRPMPYPRCKFPTGDRRGDLLVWVAGSEGTGTCTRLSLSFSSFQQFINLSTSHQTRLWPHPDRKVCVWLATCQRRATKFMLPYVLILSDDFWKITGYNFHKARLKPLKRRLNRAFTMTGLKKKKGFRLTRQMAPSDSCSQLADVENVNYIPSCCLCGCGSFLEAPWRIKAPSLWCGVEKRGDHRDPFCGW